MHDIEIKRSLPDQFFYDVMVTMAESGRYAVRYWGHFLDINRNDDKDITWCIIREGTADEPVDECAEAMLNPEHIAEAIRTILRDRPCAAYIMEYIERAVRDGDAGEIDAEAADVIAQIAVLEELRYG